MKKNETATKVVTMASALEELNAKIKEFNAESDVLKCAKIEAECKELVMDYNRCSLVNTYANLMKAELPLVELAKMYKYPQKSIRKKTHEDTNADGEITSTLVLVLEDKEANLDVMAFVEWTAEKGACVAHANNYKTKAKEARTTVANQWTKFFKSKADSEVKISIGETKRALQAMFDALVFIPCENNKDKNAVIANNKIAKWVIAQANSRKDVRLESGEIKVKGEILTARTWTTLILDALHFAVTGKDYEVIFKEEDEEAPTEVDTSAEEKTEA